MREGDRRVAGAAAPFVLLDASLQERAVVLRRVTGVGIQVDGILDGHRRCRHNRNRGRGLQHVVGGGIACRVVVIVGDADRAVVVARVARHDDSSGTGEFDPVFVQVVLVRGARTFVLDDAAEGVARHEQERRFVEDGERLLLDVEAHVRLVGNRLEGNRVVRRFFVIVNGLEDTGVFRLFARHGDRCRRAELLCRRVYVNLVVRKRLAEAALLGATAPHNLVNRAELIVSGDVHFDRGIDLLAELGVGAGVDLRRVRNHVHGDGVAALLAVVVGDVNDHKVLALRFPNEVARGHVAAEARFSAAAFPRERVRVVVGVVVVCNDFDIEMDIVVYGNRRVATRLEEECRGLVA